MLEIFYALLLVLMAYGLGSIPFAVLVSRAMGLHDPRTYGSGNPGATNVLRSGSKKAALCTLVGDAVKGSVAVWLAFHGVAQGWVSGGVIPWVALAAFIGHLYPIFLKFKGGKGVATAMGILSIWFPWLAFMTAGVWLFMLVFFHYSSLAALTAAVCMPMLYLSGHQVLWVVDMPSFMALLSMSGLLIFRHQKNISNLLKGKESKSVRAKKR